MMRSEKPALWQCHMDDGTIEHFAGIFGEVLTSNGKRVVSRTALYLHSDPRLSEYHALLREAMEVVRPFADEAAEWSWKFDDGQQVSCRPGPPHDEDEVAKFILGDLRAARLLSTKLQEALDGQ